MRWIIAIVLCLGLAGGVYYGYASWADYTVKQAELEHLRQVQKDLDVLKKQYAEEAGRTAKLGVLWKQIQEVGLAPGKWITHPLSVSKTVSWKDFSRLILLSANTIQQQGGYWFKPEHLRVLRVKGESPEGAAENGAEGGGKKPKQVELYDSTIEGKFLIRKE